ncbi:NAD-dependent epimerase/dehydratase family protein [Sinorhizobium medicae]
MHILVTGACGFLGRRLIEALLARGQLAGTSGEATPVSQIVATDIFPEPAGLPADERVFYQAGDICDPEFVARLFAAKPGSVFHLAALVSGGAEQDFDAGMKANLTGTIHLLEAARQTGVSPRFVFTSSIATYGGRSAGGGIRRTPGNAGKLLWRSEGNWRAPCERLYP